MLQGIERLTREVLKKSLNVEEHARVNGNLWFSCEKFITRIDCCLVRLDHTCLDTINQPQCRNPSLGLVTKARACKVASQKRSSGITFHALGSGKNYGGMNPHTPKWTPILGIRVPMDSWIFKKRLQESKPNGLRSYLYHWKALGT
jgi:hypothetical protein